MNEYYDVHIHDIKMNTDMAEVCKDAEMIFIAVPTPHHENYGGEKPTYNLPAMDFDYSSLEDVLIDLNDYAAPNALVTVISTVLPTTFRNRLINIPENYRLAYNPYLIAMGTVKEDFLNPEMMIAGGDEEDIKELKEFYKPIITTKVRWETGSYEEAECIKVFYNTFISMKISFVNMIQDVAMEIGHTDANMVCNALAKSKKRIISEKYMKPGLGDGGPCHPRDNIALKSLSEELKLKYDLFSSVMEARDFQAKKMSEYLLTFDLPIVFLDNGFKSESELTDGSPSLLVAAWIEDMEAQIDMFNQPKIHYEKYLSEPAVYLCSRGPSQFIIDSIADGSILVDPWGDDVDLDIPRTKKIIKYGTEQCFH
jgi:UDPglucose 6-dehydrogenase